MHVLLVLSVALLAQCRSMLKLGRPAACRFGCLVNSASEHENKQKNCQRQYDQAAYPRSSHKLQFIGLNTTWCKTCLNIDARLQVAPSHSGYLPAGGHVDGPVGFPRHNSPYLDREGHHTSTSSVYESTYETSTYDNVSRPPSFQSVKWWQGGEPDRELSQASMSTSVQPPTIAEQCSSSSLTLPSGPGNLPEPSRVATGGVDPPQAEV